jgi:hypothetical protein
MIYSNSLYLGNFDIDWNNIPSVPKDIFDHFAPVETIYLKMADRLGYLLSYQERKYAYNKTLKFWLWFFNEYRVEKAIFANIPHHGFDFIAMEVLRFLGVNLLMFNEMPVIPGRSYTLFEVRDSTNHSKYLEKKYMEIKHGEENKFEYKESVSAFKLFSPEATIPPFTRKQIAKKNNFKSVANFMQASTNFFLNGGLWNILKIRKALFMQGYYTGIGLDPFFCRPRNVRSYYDDLSTIPDLKANFVYFALHFQPELSTSPLGEHFVDQVLAIDIIANACKKLGLQLYVKEHPRIVNRTESRTKTFYDLLLVHENVKLIDSNIESKILIDRSVCVASVTGTVNFEAIFRRKSSISFGNRFYNAFDMISVVSCEKTAVEAISMALSSESKITDTDIEHCLIALDEFLIDAFLIEGDDDIATVSKVVSDQNIVNRAEKFLLLDALI